MASGTTIGTAYVQILPSADGIKGNLTKTLGGDVASAGASAGSGWASSFLSVATKAIAAIGIGKVITDSLNVGAELEQNLGGTEAVFGEFASQIQRTAKSAYENMGLSASDYMATANKMGSLFQGSGLEQQRALDLTSKAMQRAADVASVMGLDTSMAMESIAGAAKGNFTMMDNLGVAMNATTLEAYALEKGLNFKWNVASNAEKAELAMQMFFERTEQYAGNFARESSETFSGSLGAMKAAWKDTMAAFMTGEGFGAALQNFGETVKTFVGGNLIPALGRMVKQLPEIASWAIDFAKSVVSSLKSAFEERLPELKAVLQEKLGDNLFSALETAVSGAKAVFDTLITVVQFLITNFDKLKPVLVGVAAAFAAFKAGSGILTLMTTVKGIAAGIAGAGGLIPALAGLVSPLGIAAVAIGAVVAIGVALYKNWDTIKEKAQEIWASITETWAGIKESVSAQFEAIKESVSQTWDNIKESASEKWNGIKTTVVGIAENIKTAAGNTWDQIKASYEAHGGGLVGAAGVVWDAMKAKFQAGYDIINSLTGGKLDALKQKFVSVFDNVRNVVSNAIERVKSIMNFQWSLPHLPLPHFSITGSFSLVPPSVPHFSIAWYKKAYDNPFLFTEPTVVGGMGFGDGLGGEMVYGHQNLMRDIERASGGGLSSEIQDVVALLEEIRQEMRNTKYDFYMDGKKISDAVTLRQRQAMRSGGYA